MGGITIDVIEGTVDGRPINVVLDRDCQDDYLYLLDTRFVGFVTVDSFLWDPLGKVGDTAAFGQVVGEYSLVVANETWSSYVSLFSTSA